MRQTQTINCKQCTKAFQASPSEIRRGGGKYCSSTCFRKSRLGHPTSAETRRKIALANTGRKHSEATKEKLRLLVLGTDRGGNLKTCVTCSTQFKDCPSNKTVNCSKTCSAKYLSKTRSGSNSPTWKGGLTPHHLKDRRGLEYRAWRTAVFQRDNFTCQQCAKRGGKIEADHLMHFALHPDLRFEVLNGQTLCKPCHQKKTIIDRTLIQEHYRELSTLASIT